jgi:hypothetical protein
MLLVHHPHLDREAGIRSTWQWFCEHVFRD